MKMKTLLLATALVVSAGLLCAADILYITGRSTSIRRSLDGGSTWSTFVSEAGVQFRGLAVDPNHNYVFVTEYNGGTESARPLYAYNTSYTLLDSTTFDSTGAFNQNPVAYWNGYVFVNSGSAGGSSSQQTGKSYFDGTTFADKPVVNASGGSWQGNDMRVYETSGGTVYMFANGTSGTNLRRWNVAGDGTLSSSTTISISGISAQPTDFAFSSSGRLIVLNANGIWVSDTDQMASTAISVNQAVAFSSSEDPASGDMGPNGRELLLLADRLYAASDQYLYRFIFDDSAGTITFSNAVAHGFNSTGIHLDGVIPEPGVVGLGLVAGLMVVRKQG